MVNLMKLTWKWTMYLRQVSASAVMNCWTKEVIHAFIEIVRIEREEDGFQYGGLFIGMPEIDLQRIGVYNVVSEADKYRK